MIFRKGGVSVEAVEAEIGPVEVRAHSSSNPLAPGMLKSHYAPLTAFRLCDISAGLSQYAGKRIGVLSFRTHYGAIPGEWQVALSPGGDFREAARNLFAAMRYLDSLGLDLILAELLPEEDLGRAVNDRLRRAAAK